MITRCKQPNVNGLLGMEFGDRTNCWRVDLFLAKQIQRLFIISPVRMYVLRKRLMLYVRAFTLLFYIHLLLLKYLTNYI